MYVAIAMVRPNVFYVHWVVVSLAVDFTALNVNGAKEQQTREWEPDNSNNNIKQDTIKLFSVRVFIIFFFFLFFLDYIYILLLVFLFLCSLLTTRHKAVREIIFYWMFKYFILVRFVVCMKMSLCLIFVSTV